MHDNSEVSLTVFNGVYSQEGLYRIAAYMISLVIYISKQKTTIKKGEACNINTDFP